MEIDSCPFALHLFICGNTREDGSTSCGDSLDSEILSEELKKRFKTKQLPVRVSRTRCLGPCAQGPNIMIYPQQIWLKKVSPKDTDLIEKKVHTLLGM